jgi:hypothetical protein
LRICFGTAKFPRISECWQSCVTWDRFVISTNVLSHLIGKQNRFSAEMYFVFACPWLMPTNSD